MAVGLTTTKKVVGGVIRALEDVKSLIFCGSAKAEKRSGVSLLSQRGLHDGQDGDRLNAVGTFYRITERLILKPANLYLQRMSGRGSFLWAWGGVTYTHMS